jgi:uncharacterized protein YbcI
MSRSDPTAILARVMTGGELNVALAREVARIQYAYTGRGPREARAFYRDNIVVVVLESVMTKAERSLAARDAQASAIRFREALFEATRAELTAAVGRLTNGNVIALMVGIDVQADTASAVFVLDRHVEPQT